MGLKIVNNQILPTGSSTEVHIENVIFDGSVPIVDVLSSNPSTGNYIGVDANGILYKRAKTPGYTGGRGAQGNQGYGGRTGYSGPGGGRGAPSSSSILFLYAKAICSAICASIAANTLLAFGLCPISSLILGSLINAK